MKKIALIADCGASLEAVNAVVEKLKNLDVSAVVVLADSVSGSIGKVDDYSHTGYTKEQLESFAMSLQVRFDASGGNFAEELGKIGDVMKFEDYHIPKKIHPKHQKFNKYRK